MSKRRVFVCGGGASGLMAAIMAARSGASVTLAEQNEKPGKKLLATGNGRCNFTNRSVPADAWRGGCPEKRKEVLSAFSPEETEGFFRELGVWPVEIDGWLYPRSRSAANVLDLLLLEAQSLGVKLKYNTRVLSVRPKDGLWQAEVAGWTYEADALILANGSSASSIAGADGSGYALARDLGHRVVPVLPALMPLFTKEKPAWAGVRTSGTVTLAVEGEAVAEETGELQLTEYGVSGIPVFQLSRYAGQALAEQKRVTLTLNLLPEIEEKDLPQISDPREKRKVLLGLFPEKLASLLQKEENPLKKARSLTLTVTGTGREDQAQVCQGGVSLEAVKTPSMESDLHPGLFFCGEVLDVDGRCGGYNLQWAWSSGANAGRHAAEGRER